MGFEIRDALCYPAGIFAVAGKIFSLNKSLTIAIQTHGYKKGLCVYYHSLFYPIN